MSLPPPTDLKGQQGDNGTHFPNSLILNQLMNQSSNSRTQQQGGMSMLASGCGISYVPGHLSTTTTATATNNNLLAAAVQQQVMASLAAASSSQSSNFPLLHPMGQTFAKGLPPNPTGLNILSFGRQTSIDSQQREQIITEPTKNESYKSNITTTQIPCQARGMSAGHNAITAYFDIPSNAIHGQHLYCSNPTCRSAGVKFRYCLHCKKPVTKQNFRSRHLHAGVDNKKPSSVAAGIKKLKKENSKKKVVRPEVSTQNKRPPPSSSITPSGPTPALDRTIHPAPTKEEEGKVDVTKKRKEFTASLSSSSLLSPSGFDPALTVVARRRRWSSLLRERPIELSSITGWLSQVIAMSDPNIPINFTEESLLLLNHGTTGGRTSIAQQAAWDDLLTQRPEDVSTNAPTDWLVKVLTISCPVYSEAAKNIPAGGAAMMVGELATKNVGLPPHDILRRPVTADTTTSPKRAKTS